MRIKLIKGTVIRGYDGIGVNQPFECDDYIAGQMILLGRAVAVEPDRIDIREPVIENRDPVPVDIKQKQRRKSS